MIESPIFLVTEAVRIVEQSGKSVTQVAREMGLTASALSKWRNLYCHSSRLAIFGSGCRLVFP
jgi:transposase-like protein